MPSADALAQVTGQWTISGAEAGLPHWPALSVPFPLAETLSIPDAERNAAHDYLPALAEFSEDAWTCAPNGPRAAQVEAVRERLERFQIVASQLSQQPTEVRNRDVERMLAAFEPGFEQLAAAQQKRLCVFPTGLRFSAGLPHLDGARNAARISVLDVQRLCRESQIDAAVERVAVLLRLSRDLRPRGFVICQLVSIGIDSLILGQMVPEILRAEATGPQHCDRLLRLLNDHASQGLDAFQEAVRMDYILVRRMLEDLEHGTGDFSSEGIRQLGFESDTAAADVLARLLGIAEDEQLRNELIERVNGMDENAYRREVAALTDATRRLLAAEQVPFRPFVDNVIDNEVQLVEHAPLASQLDTELVPLSRITTRARAQLAGTQALVTVRRYELAFRDHRPRSLLEAARSAGLREVPRDPFSGDPIRMTELEGQLVVYSVGYDGIDQQGKLDWETGRAPGDFLFRLPLAEQPKETRRQ